MGPSGCIGYILHILDCLGQDMQVLYLGRAPRTKETLPDFLKWHRVTRPPLVFRGLTSSQRTPGFGASHPPSLMIVLGVPNLLRIFLCKNPTTVLASFFGHVVASTHFDT